MCKSHQWHDQARILASQQGIPEPQVQPPLRTPKAGPLNKGGATTPRAAPTEEAWAIKADWQPFQAAQQRQALQGRQRPQPSVPALAGAAVLPELQGEHRLGLFDCHCAMDAHYSRHLYDLTALWRS